MRQQPKIHSLRPNSNRQHNRQPALPIKKRQSHKRQARHLKERHEPHINQRQHPIRKTSIPRIIFSRKWPWRKVHNHQTQIAQHQRMHYKANLLQRRPPRSRPRHPGHIPMEHLFNSHEMRLTSTTDIASALSHSNDAEK